MLQPFGQNIWFHDGANVVGALGFHYPTRMAVIRLDSGGLFVWSPTAPTDELKSALAELGPVAHIVAPNTLHHTYTADWQALWPDAKLHAPELLAGKRPDLRVDHYLGEIPDGDWPSEVEVVVLPATSVMTEAVFFHRASGTVLFTDLLQNLPRHWYSGWRRLVARLDLMLRPEPTVPRKFRMAFTDKAAARQAVSQVLLWPAQKVLMAHGTPVEQDAPAFLKRAFAWLMD